ncbi:hypothetical protein Glove_395g74 [Diversispora epigaea]|uniref:Uncharacterized protein n=1 Tax=Diversispora epigaea TaxID=1348612 RepID=A0A397H6E9_9GLOM|nr:hypothetical protein Glove_395g74 [Diversispora epigaea]
MENYGYLYLGLVFLREQFHYTGTGFKSSFNYTIGAEKKKSFVYTRKFYCGNHKKKLNTKVDNYISIIIYIGIRIKEEKIFLINILSGHKIGTFIL